VHELVHLHLSVLPLNKSSRSAEEQVVSMIARCAGESGTPPAFFYGVRAARRKRYSDVGHGTRARRLMCGTMSGSLRAVVVTSAFRKPLFTTETRSCACTGTARER